MTTRDGYILELHRIPPKLTDAGCKPKVVFFQNGLLATSGAGLIKGIGPNRTTNGSLGNIIEEFMKYLLKRVSCA